MKLHQTTTQDHFVISKLASDFVIINQQKHFKSCIVSATEIIANIPINSIEQLTEKHIAQLLTLNPEIIILGSGAKHKFPDVHLLNEIAIKNIGLEVMNNQSAARTYNVLLAEERKVVCLLLFA